MIFTPTPLSDAWLIELEPKTDSRGYFARTYCEEEFSRRGLNCRWPQMNQSYSALSGTLRGMHYQRGIHATDKLIRCLKGSVCDVIVDLRLSAPTRHQWFTTTLSEDRLTWLYVPKGFAHGFITMTAEVMVEYLMSANYDPESEAGFRYDDKYFKLPWPREVEIISPKDRAWPDFDPASDPLAGGSP